GVGVAVALDKPMQNWMVDHQSTFGSDIADVVSVFGEKKIIIPALGVTLGVSYLIKDEKLKRASWNAVKAVAVTALATEGIKVAAGRARPFVDEGPHFYQPFSKTDRYMSLPSGHTSLAFAVFTPYAETYSRWIYVLPASVGFARMYNNKHWFSDVVLGGSIGFISGWIFTHYPRKNIEVSANGIVVFF
ncbi:MAG: phosphatase PAP2 family protein, partial [Marinilabiliaceae bacterium]|nr:phosphatase PAP2 family protein [Marinilabiliaceae bacterium]